MLVCIYIYIEEYIKIHGSAVGIATGYKLDDIRFGVGVPISSRIFTSSYLADSL
jgi:hypothetical protein